MDENLILVAALRGDVREVERLVGQDPSPLDARNWEEMTPLMLACARGHLEVVRLLLDKGAALDATGGNYENEDTALSFASLRGHAAVVRLLMERGADPTIAGRAGYTPLIFAAKFGHLEVVRLLLGHPAVQATINYRNTIYGQTALFNACFWGRGTGV
jgi:uncharacterized protein